MTAKRSPVKPRFTRAKVLKRRVEMAGITKPGDPEFIKGVVNAMDPITLWHWKKAINERFEHARENA